MHRPYPPPTSPWVMAQQWHDLLFMHWPLPADDVRRVLPEPLELDLYDGLAWVGVVPFTMRGVRPRGVPPLPGLSAFPELNVRTYALMNGQPGVYFFSLDAANRVAVRAARVWANLPYFDARMRCRVDGDVRYASIRTHRNAPPARFKARYAPDGDAFVAARGSLEYFLTERYCLLAPRSDGRVKILEIDHAPWKLRPAVAEVQENSMAAAAGITLPDTPPLLHFVERQDMVGWWPRAMPRTRETD